MYLVICFFIHCTGLHCLDFQRSVFRCQFLKGNSCEADVNYTQFYPENSEKLLVSKTLKEYSELLEPAGFFRTHQSHLVNLDHVIRFDKTEGGHLVMADESIVPVSSRKRETLFKTFEQM